MIEVPIEQVEIVKRKWRVQHEPKHLISISESRDKWVQWLKRTNGSANKEVWQVYDHLATDLFNDVMKELMTTIDRDLDTYCEQIIYDEF